MDYDPLDDEVLSHLEISRRDLVRRLVVGTAFAVPIVASFDMAALTTSSAEALSPNQIGVGTANQTLAAPQFTSAAAATFRVGQPGSFLITAPGGPGPRITFAGTLPAGITLLGDRSGSATLSGTPGADTGGVYELALTAANGRSPNATQTFVLTIEQSPAIVSAAAASFVVGRPGAALIVATGFPVPSISHSSGLPAGLKSVPDNAEGTAIISGTPTARSLGTHQLTVHAANGIPPDATQSLALTVRAAGSSRPDNHFTVTNVNRGRGGALAFLATVPGAGAIDIVVSAPRGGRLAHKHVKVRSAGGVRLRLSAPATLPSSVTLSVTFTPSGGSARTIRIRGVRAS